MDIYIVQQGDSIYSIAEKYGIAVEKIAIDNGFTYPYRLVVGQTIVIAYAQTDHTVQQGDTLLSIANTYNVTINQILRNNPYLVEREYLYPGEKLVISYDTIKKITTVGFAYPFIKRESLIKTLPSLTYLSIFNYSLNENSEIIEYQDDTEIVTLAKVYGTVPLLMISTLTPQGEMNIEAAYKILLDEEAQDKIIENFIKIMKEKGYSGVNTIFNFLNVENQILYLNYVKKVSKRIIEEGFWYFITINYHELSKENINEIFNVDFAEFNKYVNGMVFLRIRFGAEYGPPAPISNINDLKVLVNHLIAEVPSNKVIIGKPMIGYDWQLPYIPEKSSAVSLTVSACYDLAYGSGSEIQFDEVSQTPYFYYVQFGIEYPIQHIVWFIDARSIDAMNKLIIENDLAGSGIWNIMIYNAQLWTIINSVFDIVKLV